MTLAAVKNLTMALASLPKSSCSAEKDMLLKQSISTSQIARCLLRSRSLRQTGAKKIKATIACLVACRFRVPCTVYLEIPMCSLVFMYLQE